MSGKEVKELVKVFEEDLDSAILEIMPEWFKILRDEYRKRKNREESLRNFLKK